MRLSEDKARQLSALVWRERLRRWLPVFAGIVVLAAGFGIILSNQMARSDRTVEVQERAGTVTDIKSGNNARGAAIVHVHLDDGRDVEAFSGFRVVPTKGTHVVVTEAKHASGRLTYDVIRVTEH
jgi:hypothetical protein